MIEKTTKKKIKPLTDGERTIRLPENLMRVIFAECVGRGATTKTSLVTELLWEKIGERRKIGAWRS